MPDTSRLILLAEALLDFEWTVAAHESLLQRVAKRNSAAYQRLAEAIHRELPHVPSRTRLIEFFLAHSECLKGLSWKRLSRAYEKIKLRPPTMRAACKQHLAEAIPELPTYAHAIDLLGLPLPIINWLASAHVQHYVVKTIEKRHRSTGSIRILEQPKYRLKTAQRDILREILRFVPVHPAAHGFVRRRSVASFAQPHVGQPAVLRMDLANFFPSITAARVSAVFRSLGYPYAVTYLLTDLCTTATKLESVPGMELLHPSDRNVLQNLYSVPHLPQGAPTSPALANLVAWRLDARLSGLARAAGYTYTRYADDLLFSGDRSLARSVDSLIANVMAIAIDEGFRVQTRKTRLMPQAIRQATAGVVLNHHLNIRRPDYDNLKATLTNCVRLGPASQNRATHANFRAHLLGRISWVTQVNPARGAKLQAIFTMIQW